MHPSSIPGHSAAQWLMSHVHNILDALGLEKEPATEEVIYVCLAVVIALAVGWLIRRMILFAAQKFVLLRKMPLADDLLRQKVLTHCSYVISPLVILALVPFAFTAGSDLLAILQRVLIVYTVGTLAIAINSVITFIWTRYDVKRNTKNLPLKGILNTCMGIVWGIAVIISVSVLVHRSPAVLLTGLGAFAAALMLIFKDTILGFVAGIQLSQNDMLHVGDWIVVPSTPANGTVIDVSLTAVKVQNFDNTIVTLPPYTLVSTSFQNWRGMSDSGCRRIARAVTIESESIVDIDADTVAALAKQFPIMAPAVDNMQKKGASTPIFDPGLSTVNGTVSTNLGLFRTYLCCYILAKPQFRHDQQVLIRTLDPTNQGYPLQIYCFTSTTAWTAYEAIQSALFEHVATVAPKFGLKIFNTSSVLDTTTVKMLPSDDASKAPA